MFYHIQASTSIFITILIKYVLIARGFNSAHVMILKIEIFTDVLAIKMSLLINCIDSKKMGLILNQTRRLLYVALIDRSSVECIAYLSDTHVSSYAIYQK